MRSLPLLRFLAGHRQSLARDGQRRAEFHRQRELAHRFTGPALQEVNRAEVAMSFRHCRVGGKDRAELLGRTVEVAAVEEDGAPVVTRGKIRRIEAGGGLELLPGLLLFPEREECEPEV